MAINLGNVLETVVSTGVEMLQPELGPEFQAGMTLASAAGSSSTGSGQASGSGQTSRTVLGAAPGSSVVDRDDVMGPLDDAARAISFSRAFSDGFFDGPDPSREQVNDWSNQLIAFLGRQSGEIADLQAQGGAEGLRESGTRTVPFTGVQYDVSTSATAGARAQEAAARLEKALAAYNAAADKAAANPGDPDLQVGLRKAADAFSTAFSLAAGIAGENEAVADAMEENLRFQAANPATTASGSPAASSSPMDQVNADIGAVLRNLQPGESPIDGAFDDRAVRYAAQFITEEAKLGHIESMHGLLGQQIGDMRQTLQALNDRIDELGDTPGASREHIKELKAARADIETKLKEAEKLHAGVGRSLENYLIPGRTGDLDPAERMSYGDVVNSIFRQTYRATSGSELSLTVAAGLLNPPVAQGE